MPAAQPRPASVITTFQLLAAMTSAGIAFTVLSGWITGTPALTRILSQSIAMNPMTAGGILMVSAGMLLRASRHSTKVSWLGGLTAFIGIAKLGQLILGLPVGIDQLLFVDQLAGIAGSPPNRMAPNTAFALATIGLGLAASRSRHASVLLLSQFLCMLTAATASFALVGYAFDEAALYQVHRYIAMAFSTGVALLVLSLAIVTTKPDVGLMRIVGDHGPAGSLARIALPLALLVPVIASVVGLSGQRAGYYGPEASIMIVLLANVLVNFVLLGGWTVAHYRSDVDRQARDAAIARSEQQYRQAEGVAHIGYWRVEFPSESVQWSDGFVKICGLPADAPPNLKTAVGIYHPDDAQMARLALATAQQDCSNWEFSCRVRRPDGDFRHIKSRGVCECDADGKTIEIFGVILDVSDLEMARREAEAAKTTTTTFLANMSHEIRTPMNGVMGFVELLLDSKLDGTQRRHLTLIQDSANALLKLLNDILDISKIDAGRLEIAETPYNIRRGIKQCVRLMTPMAEEKGLSLSLSLRNDVPAHLITDGLRLRQILLNLIGNAVKFTHRGAISVVIAKGIRGDGRDTLRVSVEDSGIGIHPDRRATIFGAFVQAELTTTRRFGGSGLGLSISLQLAEMMGGTIEVDSVLGKGTTMTLVLPLVESSAAEVADAAEIASALPKEIAPPEPNSGQASVLLVEDVDINQELFAEMLIRLGHRFRMASDGAEAVELAKRLQTEPDAWDLILMDLQMPVMDGLAATTAIRKMGARAATIPIVALTASAFEKERRQCKAAGMNDHLAKPVGIEALRRMIDRWQGTSDRPANTSATEEAGPVRSASLDRRIKSRLRSSAERLTEILEGVSGSRPNELKLLMVEAKKIAHVLAGTAGMVGEEALGDLASATEMKIESWAKRNSAPALITARTAIERLVAALTAEQSGLDGVRAREA